MAWFHLFYIIVIIHCVMAMNKWCSTVIAMLRHAFLASLNVLYLVVSYYCVFLSAVTLYMYTVPFASRCIFLVTLLLCWIRCVTTGQLCFVLWLRTWACTVSGHNASRPIVARQCLFCNILVKYKQFNVLQPWLEKHLLPSWPWPCKRSIRLN